MKLSVCMIVKDREEKIKHAIESIYSAADEIIVTDTGSTDKTKENAAKYDKVKLYNFPWIDDFSAARNFGIEKATGDIIFILDSDEICLNPESIKAAVTDAFDCYYVNLKYGRSDQITFRMWKSGKGIKYAGPCHEIPIGPVDESRIQKKTDIQLQHVKYAHEEKENCSVRNVRILEKYLRKHPHALRELFYYAYALKEVGQLDAAVGVFQRYLYLECHAKTPYVEQAFIAQLNIGYIRDFQGYPLLAIDEYNSAIKILPIRREAHFAIGRINFLLDRFDKCIDYMKLCTDYPIPEHRMWVEVDCYGWEPWRFIVLSYEKKQEFQRAIFNCDKAIERKLNPDFFEPKKVQLEILLKNSKRLVIECHRQGAFGDILMTTAAVKALKEKHTGCYLRYVTHALSLPMLEGNPYIDELTCAGKSDAKKLVLFTYAEEANEGKTTGHLIDRFNACAGIPDAGRNLVLKLDDDKDMVLYRQYKDACFTAGLGVFKPYVTIHTTPGWSPYKAWYKDRWEAVVSEIAKMGYLILQIGYPGNDERVEAAADYRGENFRAAFGLLSKASLHIGVDSVFCHAAAALGVPAVILYGSTDPGRFGHHIHRNIYKGIDCQPCMRNYNWAPRYVDECPHNKRCMDLITVEDVMIAVKEVLK